jgi:hypothetical protein
MRLILAHRLTTQAGACPYRVIDERGHEILWANDYLDAQHLRQLSARSLRAYAYDLLHFARWFQSRPQTLTEITESTLLDYVRDQLNQLPQPTPQTVKSEIASPRRRSLRCARWRLQGRRQSLNLWFPRSARKLSFGDDVDKFRRMKEDSFGVQDIQPRRFPSLQFSLVTTSGLKRSAYS